MSCVKQAMQPACTAEGTHHELAVDASPVQQDVLHAHVIYEVGFSQRSILLGLHPAHRLSNAAVLWPTFCYCFGSTLIY